jgi:hypothetical protein
MWRLAVRGAICGETRPEGGREERMRPVRPEHVAALRAFATAPVSDLSLLTMARKSSLALLLREYDRVHAENAALRQALQRISDGDVECWCTHTSRASRFTGHGVHWVRLRRCSACHRSATNRPLLRAEGGTNTDCYPVRQRARVHAGRASISPWFPSPSLQVDALQVTAAGCRLGPHPPLPEILPRGAAPVAAGDVTRGSRARTTT